MSKHKQRASVGEVSHSRESGAAPRPTQARRFWRAGVPLLLGVAVIAVVTSKPGRDAAPPTSATAPTPMVSQGASGQPLNIPRLVDLGADKCIPCKAMAPILVELRAEYAWRMKVDFIDVWKDPSAGEPYRIYAIPTQIFFDANGKELTRHEGFISKSDILATWTRLGYDFETPGAAPPRS